MMVLYFTIGYDCIHKGLSPFWDWTLIMIPYMASYGIIHLEPKTGLASVIVSKIKNDI